MKAIIFGANGQDGIYLSQLLQLTGIELIKVSRSGNDLRGDVSNRQFVEQLVKSILPDFIFHLAANSTTRYDALFENHETISTGTLNILDSVKNYSPNTKVFITGSAVQFKNTGEPIDENTEFDAWNAYAVARIQSVYAARFFRSLGIKVYVGYLFHHESPFRKENHISKKIAEAVKRIANGSKEKIEIGDINVIKEWNFADDVVNAIWTLVNQNIVFEAVIGSGITYSIADWLQVCFNLIGKNYQEHVIYKSDFSPEYKALVSKPELIKALDWQPKISFEELAKLMINS